MIALLVLGGTCGVCTAGRTAGDSAQPNTAQPLPPDEPPFLEDQIKSLPPGVELLPDGTMMQDGAVIGHAAIDSPERRKMRRVHEFSDQWIPAFLYLDDYRLFAPYKLRDVATFEAGEERLTGLVAASGSDVLVYAVTRGKDSRLVLRYLPEYRIPEEHVIADADQIASDAWFGPLYLSPNKRWIIASVLRQRSDRVISAPERGAEDAAWYLLDASRQVGPRKLIENAQVLSASWSANGSRAALEVQSASEPESTLAMLLVNAETGSLTHLDAPPGLSSWSPSSDALFIAPRETNGRAVLRYDLRSGQIQPYASAPGPALWSSDFSRYALLDNSRLRVGDGFGHSRLAHEDTVSGHALAWSNRGELLTFRLPNDTLGFSVGSVRTGAYDRIIAACPPAWTEPDPERPGLHKTMMDGMALDTRLSPITVGSDPLAFHTWAETADGPCFIWSESTGEGTKLRILRFVTLTAERLGIDPRADLQTQMVEQAIEDAAGTLAHALRSYALDHDGRLPNQVGGLGLEEALKPYVYDPHAFRSLFAPEDVCARVLRPGANLLDLVASTGPARRVTVARIAEGTLAYEVVALPGRPSALSEALDESHGLPVELRAVPEGEPAE
ncbi:MAG: hypothetical protein JXA57_12125 [Armatimonadetes bacterium]|nr:hypothetical protein [Armatimonadota bacterium]